MIRSIYKTGSQCILFHPHDKDFIIYCDTNEEINQLKNQNKDIERDNHYTTLEKGKQCDIYIGCYIYPFMELIYGEEIKELKNFSIFDHKSEIKAMLLSHLEYIRDK